MASRTIASYAEEVSEPGTHESIDPEPAEPAERAGFDVLDSLVQASFTVMALLSQAAARHDLSLTQLRVLAILRDRQPLISQLATHLGLERSTVSGLIDRAVKRGLVQREVSSHDARAVRVSLTPQARQLEKAITQEVAEQLSTLTDRLTPAEQKRLSGLLRRMLDG
jgi:DNA-binding MarR family transcriptional regulator